MPERRTRATKKKTTRKRTRRTISTSVNQNKRTIKDETREEDAGALDCARTASVSVGNKITKSLAQYESLSVSVIVSMPCLPTESELRKTYKETSALVEDLMDEEFTRAYAAL
jgi:hypothetical protein